MHYLEEERFKRGPGGINVSRQVPGSRGEKIVNSS